MYEGYIFDKIFADPFVLLITQKLRGYIISPHKCLYVFTPVLRSIHWLSITFVIDFKAFLLVYINHPVANDLNKLQLADRPMIYQLFKC